MHGSQPTVRARIHRCIVIIYARRFSADARKGARTRDATDISWRSSSTVPVSTPSRRVAPDPGHPALDESALLETTRDWSSLAWSPSARGTVPPNQPGALSVEARTTEPRGAGRSQQPDTSAGGSDTTHPLRVVTRGCPALSPLPTPNGHTAARNAATSDTRRRPGSMRSQSSRSVRASPVVFMSDTKRSQSELVGRAKIVHMAEHYDLVDGRCNCPFECGVCGCASPRRPSHLCVPRLRYPNVRHHRVAIKGSHVPVQHDVP